MAIKKGRGPVLNRFIKVRVPRDLMNTLRIVVRGINAENTEGKNITIAEFVRWAISAGVYGYPHIHEDSSFSNMPIKEAIKVYYRM